MANGSPKPAFFVSVLVVVLGLVGLGLWRFNVLPGSIAKPGSTSDNITPG